MAKFISFTLGGALIAFAAYTVDDIGARYGYAVLRETLADSNFLLIFHLGAMLFFAPLAASFIGSLRRAAKRL